MDLSRRSSRSKGDAPITRNHKEIYLKGMTEPEAFRQAISKMNLNDEEEGKNHLVSTAPDVNSHPT
jgi:hypothetical protein